MPAAEQVDTQATGRGVIVEAIQKYAVLASRAGKSINIAGFQKKMIVLQCSVLAESGIVEEKSGSIDRLVVKNSTYVRHGTYVKEIRC